MNILLVPDKFKGSLTAGEVIQAIKEGLQDTDPFIKTFHILAADGGDGFLEAVSHHLDTVGVVCKTVDPRGRIIQAPYLFHKAQKTACIELAKASGLELLSPAERNVMETSTYGTGLQIRHAIQKGATHIYLGLGGSATNDAGTGIAAALGCRFYNISGAIAVPKGKDLNEITDIDCNAISDLGDISFFAVNDVQNPLFGENGAAYIYGKQKGATDRQIKQLDAGLRNLSAVVKKKSGKDMASIAGSGAAGGTAYGLKAFLNAGFKSGTEFILGLTNFFEIINSRKIDCIITGEGKIDRQTQNGKLIKGITTIAGKYKIPVLAICGKLELDTAGIEGLGLKAAVEIHDKTRPDVYSFKHAATLIKHKIKYLIKEVM